MIDQPLSTLLRAEPLIDRLADCGLSGTAAREKATLFRQAAMCLLENGANETSMAFACFVPGRIEVLGKHTDYAGGRSVLAAVERGFCTVAIPQDTSRIHITGVSDKETATFNLDSDIQPRMGHWSNYPMTVARRVAANFPGHLRGADMAFISDLPRDAGMSSSSAMVVSTFFVLEAANALPERDEYMANLARVEDLAGYLGTIENGLSFGPLVGDRGVGTFGGSEDHTAMLCARRGQLVQYAYCPVRFERSLDIPHDHVFIIADSGVVADKTGSALQKYNRVSKLASAALEVWCQATGRNDAHLAAAVASSPDAAVRFRDALKITTHPAYETGLLKNRLEQFICESEQIIPAVASKIAGPHLAEFGALVDRSQTLGETLLGNQTPETAFLARQARDLGASAASAFGAGFGGSVWPLAPESAAAGLIQRWSDAYAQAFPGPAAEASFFTTCAGPAAFRL